MSDKTIPERLASIETVCAELKDMLIEHKKLMYGNGTAGCQVRLSSLEKTAETNVLNISHLFAKMGKVQRTLWIVGGFIVGANVFISHPNALGAVVKLIGL